MLVLSRKEGESIQIGTGPDAVMVTVVRIKQGGDAVRIGIEAPKSVRVMRSELLKEIEHGQGVADEQPRDEL